MNLKGLEEIKSAVGGSMRARVGVLGGHAARTDSKTGINNATLMLIQMFGSLSRNIPARDPLYMPLIRHRRELMQKLGSNSMHQAFMAKDFKKMFLLLGVAAEEIVQNAFETSGDGTWAPNLAGTIAAKGSSKPLINTGELRKSISSDVVNNSDPHSSSVQIAGGS